MTVQRISHVSRRPQSSQEDATPAPAGPPWPAGATAPALPSIVFHPEIAYEADRIDRLGGDLHAVPAFSRVGATRFPRRTR